MYKFGDIVYCTSLKRKVHFMAKRGDRYFVKYRPNKLIPNEDGTIDLTFAFIPINEIEPLEVKFMTDAVQPDKQYPEYS